MPVVVTEMDAEFATVNFERNKSRMHDTSQCATDRQRKKEKIGKSRERTTRTRIQ